MPFNYSNLEGRKRPYVTHHRRRRKGQLIKISREEVNTAMKEYFERGGKITYLASKEEMD
jgi:hypothetical protein